MTKEYFTEQDWDFGKAYYVVYHDREEVIYPQLVLDDCIYWLDGNGESAHLPIWDARKYLIRAPEFDMIPANSRVRSTEE
jgi:hypothetical protein